MPERKLYLQRIIDEQPAGCSIDMSTDSTLEVSSGSIYEIVYSPGVETPVTLKKGWNFIGCPVLSTQSERKVFDNLLHSLGDQKVIWYWKNGRYAIWPDDEPASSEVGYFVYSDGEDRTISIAGIKADGVMLLHPGWNLVSPPRDCLMPATEGMVSQAWHLRSSVYQFVVNGGTLKEGSCYWIFVNAEEPVMVDFGN